MTVKWQQIAKLSAIIMHITMHGIVSMNENVLKIGAVIVFSLRLSLERYGN